MEIQRQMKRSLAMSHRKYLQLSTAIDKQNEMIMAHTNSNINNSANIRMDNELIIKYTDAVYLEYNISKPYAISHSHINQINKGNRYNQLVPSKTYDIKDEYKQTQIQSQAQIQLQTKRSNRKPIRLNKLKSQCNDSQWVVNSPTSRPSLKLRLNGGSGEGKASGQKTPSRPRIQGIKKAINNSTAGSTGKYNSLYHHNRCKSGVASTALHLNNSHTKQRQLEQISVSEFEELNCSQYQAHCEDSRSSGELKENKVDAKHVYCPICEAQLSQQLIQQHEQLCQQLQHLYQLPVPQLLQFVKWKVQQHQSAIASHLTQHNQQQHQSWSQLQQESEYVNNNKSSSMGRNMRIRSTMQLCGEQLTKCMWFTDIKEQLIAKSQIITATNPYH